CADVFHVTSRCWRMTPPTPPVQLTGHAARAVISTERRVQIWDQFYISFKETIPPNQWCTRQELVTAACSGTTGVKFTVDELTEVIRGRKHKREAGIDSQKVDGEWLYSPAAKTPPGPGAAAAAAAASAAAGGSAASASRKRASPSGGVDPMTTRLRSGAKKARPSPRARSGNSDRNGQKGGGAGLGGGLFRFGGGGVGAADEEGGWSCAVM
ncbi:unnamed protein product, partial [Ectocarpus sp. 6 AP-2014]